MLSVEDRIAITDVIHLHGHLSDRGDLEALDRVFTDDVAYDLDAFGAGVIVGLAALREAALALGAGNPVGHHVTNTVLSEDPDGTVRALSKYLGVMTDGSVGSGTYEDTVDRTADGWRITARVVRPRRVLLQP